jgi:phage terminase small subunit
MNEKAQTLLATREQASFGPAMQALPTDAMRAFVLALVERRGNATQAAADAGYTLGKDNTIVRVTAHRLMHDERVQQAIHEEAVKQLGKAKIIAVATLVDIAESAPENKDRLKAAGMILNRTGLHEKTEHEVKVTHETNDEMRAKIEKLASVLNLDPKDLMRQYGVVIEGEFTEVTRPALPAPEEMSFDGIEDL